MSRFRDGTPRKGNQENTLLSHSPEDEIINSILRERQERLQTVSPSKGLAGHVSVLHAPIAETVRPAQEPAPMPATPQQQIFPQHGKPVDMSTPLHLFSSSYEVEGGRDFRQSLPAANDEECARSYMSHTKESVDEASAVLNNSTVSRRLSESPTSFRAISQMMARVKSNTSDTSQLYPSNDHELSRIPRASPTVLPKFHDQSLDRDPAQMFYEQEHAGPINGREVADGYISPPQSRHTSPKSPRNILTTTYFHSPTPTYERDSVRTTLNPIVQNPHGQAPLPRALAQLNHNILPSSPRSRLTRTLIEIQQDLASSREGIESIESRLGVLEQHKSLNADQMKKHVEDCIRNMVDEAEESLLASEESVPSEKADGDLDLASGTVEWAQQHEVAVNQGQMRLRDDKGLITYTVKTLALIGLGLLAAEYLLVCTINELGRRHILFMS